jgi:hypothetical protein
MIQGGLVKDGNQENLSPSALDLSVDSERSQGGLAVRGTEIDQARTVTGKMDNSEQDGRMSGKITA